MASPTHLDDLLPYLMNRLVARLNQNLSERLRRLGFSFQDWRILAVLAAHDGITLSELAEAAVIPQPSVSRLTSQLEGRGLVERRSASSDQRYVHIFLTKDGKAAYERMFPLAVGAYREAVAGFGESETEEIAEVLRRMLRNVGLRLPGQAAADSGSAAEEPAQRAAL